MPWLRRGRCRNLRLLASDWLASLEHFDMGVEHITGNLHPPMSSGAVPLVPYAVDTRYGAFGCTDREVGPLVRYLATSNQEEILSRDGFVDGKSINIDRWVHDGRWATPPVGDAPGHCGGVGHDMRERRCCACFVLPRHSSEVMQESASRHTAGFLRAKSGIPRPPRGRVNVRDRWAVCSKRSLCREGKVADQHDVVPTTQRQFAQRARHHRQEWRM